MPTQQARVPADDDPHASLRSDWWVYLCIPLCVFLAHWLLGNRLQDVPLWMRLSGSGFAAVATWVLLKWSGLVRRMDIDPVLSGAFMVFLGALLGMQAPALINAAGPVQDWGGEVELPVLGIADRGIKVPVPKQFQTAYVRGEPEPQMGGTKELVVVSRSPIPPHERLLLAVDDLRAARDHGCVRVQMRDGLLGFPSPGIAEAVPCSTARGIPSSGVEWKRRPFAEWRWTEHHAGSSSEESP